MENMHIPFNWPNMTGKELHYIAQAHFNGKLTNYQWIRHRCICGTHRNVFTLHYIYRQQPCAWPQGWPCDWTLAQAIRCRLSKHLWVRYWLRQVLFGF